MMVKILNCRCSIQLTMKPNRPDEFFPITQWSLIEAVRRGEDETALEALNRLLGTYYPVLLEYLQTRYGVDRCQAEEWLSSFLWKKAFLGMLFQKDNRRQGRCRALLITALQNYVRDDLKKKRVVEVPLEEVPSEVCVGKGTDQASVVMEMAWARQVLEKALNQMDRTCRPNGHQRVWKVFEKRVLNPILNGVPPPCYKELQVELGVEDAAAAGNALVTAKKMFSRMLHEAIGEYAASEQEVEDEIKHFMSVLTNHG